MEKKVFEYKGIFYRLEPNPAYRQIVIRVAKDKDFTESFSRGVTDDESKKPEDVILAVHREALTLIDRHLALCESSNMDIQAMAEFANKVKA